MFGRRLIRILLWNNVIQTWYGHCPLGFSAAVVIQGWHKNSNCLLRIIEWDQGNTAFSKVLKISTGEVTQTSSHPKDLYAANGRTSKTAPLFKAVYITSELLGEEFSFNGVASLNFPVFQSNPFQLFFSNLN